MSIITFWSNGIERQIGKTLATVAIATNFAIEHNKRTLIISTSYSDRTLLNCYRDEQQEKVQKSILSSAKKEVQLGIGINGLYAVLKSGRITPDIIKDYTKIIFKDRLEILTNLERTDKINIEEKEINQSYNDIIKVANQYYDYVFVDLDNSIGEEQITQILNQSDIIVEVFSQRITKIRELVEKREKNPILKQKNVMLLLSKYDKDSKYKVNNLSRFLNEKKQISVIPYDNLFFEASEEGTIADLFLKLRRLKDTTDTHAIFIEEVKKTGERILEREAELKLRIR